jgi:hypothetical protein
MTAAESGAMGITFAEDARPAVTVVVPPDGSLDDEASRIVQAVRRCHDVEIEILSGDRAVQQLPTKHAIALGCLADNPFIETLYRRWNCLVDRWYPGEAGWVIQTITSPWRHGEHVLLLGGSDATALHTAVSEWIETLDEGSTQITWRLKVQLGREHLPLPEDRIDVMGTSASMVATPESALPTQPYESGWTSEQASGPAQQHLLRLGMYGPHADNFHLSRSSQLGLRYLYTGREEDAQGYRRALLAEARAGVVAKLYHYKSLRMFQLWGLLAPSPVFTDDDREEISSAIRDYLLNESGIAQIDAIRSASIPTQIFSRHHACEALNLWAGADWLWRQTGESRWLADRAIADAYFESQAGTDVPLTGLTEGYASYLEVVLEWMLLSCPERIADDTHIRLWAERVLGLCTNMGQLVLGPQTDNGRYPYHLLRKLAFLLNDGRFLLASNLREHQVKAGIDRVLQFSAGQAYAGDVEASEPSGDPEMTIYPVNERLRSWQAPSIAADRGFDRAVARSGWHAQSDYLMVIGMRSGGKSLPNVGALAAYERFGQRLITSEAVPLFPHSASAWRHSTVTLGVGGLGFGMAEGAEILTEREIAGGRWLAFRVTVGSSAWTRQLYWKPSAFLLVIDHVTLPSQDGQSANDQPLHLGVNWRCGGSLLSIDGGLATLDLGPGAAGRFHVEVSGNLSLESEHNTYPAIGAPPGTTPLTETMLHATVDPCDHHNTAEVATLLHADTTTDRPRYRLRGHAGNWRIEGTGETHSIRGDAERGEMEIEIGEPGTRETVIREPVIQEPVTREPDTGELDTSEAETRETGPSSNQSMAAGEDRRTTITAAGTDNDRGSSVSSDQSRASCDLPIHWAHDLPAPAATSTKTQITTWTQGEDGSIALGTDSGDVIILDELGNRRSTASVDASVTALSFLGRDLIVGSHSGQVSRFDEAGSEQWRHQCHFRSERTFYPYWFLETPSIGALAAGHDPASARDLVAAGTGSTSLNFLDASTGELIQDQLSPYGLADRIRTHQPAGGGALQFLVGHSWLTCGSTVRVWSFRPETPALADAAPKTRVTGQTTGAAGEAPKEGSTDSTLLSALEGIRYNRNVDAMGRSGGDWDSCGIVDFWVGSLAPGMAEVIILLRHGSVNQVTLYDEATGDPLWDATLAGSPIALAVVPGASMASSRCYVADQFGWLVGFDGEGQPVLATHVASSLQGMHAGLHGEHAGDTGSLALWNDHELHLGPAEAITHHHNLSGTPLGWWQHEQTAGLLCHEAGQLVLRRVSD